MPHNHTIFLLIICLHLGRHLEYIEMLNDARVASLGFLKNNICTIRIHKEKKFKIKFQVLLKFAKILPDYHYNIRMKSMIKNRSMVNHIILSRGIKYIYMNILTWTILKKAQVLNGCETYAFKYI